MGFVYIIFVSFHQKSKWQQLSNGQQRKDTYEELYKYWHDW